MALLLAPQSLADAHWARLELIRLTVIRDVEALWAGSAAPPLDETVQRVLAAQAAAVAQTDTYLAVSASVTLDAPFTPIGIDPDPLIGMRARHGTPLEEVYARAVKAGRESGLQRGMALLRQSIVTDVGLAQRNASHAGMQARNDVAGWRRVLNPGAGEVCGLCVAASTRVYRREDLQPIHRSCRCTVRPVHDSSYKGRTLDKDRLDAVYARTGGATEPSALGKVQFTAGDLPPGVDSDALDALNVRVVNDRELGAMLTGDRHDTHFAVSA